MCARIHQPQFVTTSCQSAIAIGRIQVSASEHSPAALELQANVCSQSLLRRACNVYTRPRQAQQDDMRRHSQPLAMNAQALLQACCNTHSETRTHAHTHTLKTIVWRVQKANTLIVHKCMQTNVWKAQQVLRCLLMQFIVIHRLADFDFTDPHIPSAPEAVRPSPPFT
jgi:hypothetical protein